MRIIHACRDPDIVELTVANAGAGLSKLERVFGPASAPAMVNIFLAPSRSVFDQLVGHLTSTPTQPGRVGQSQGHDMYLLSPETWETEASGEWLSRSGGYDAGMYRRLIEHELVHVVEERLSPLESMEERPSWFSEGLAVYLSEQYRCDLDLIAGMVACLDTGAPPMIAKMQGNDAYLWGWSVIRFLQRRYGWRRIATTMRSSSSAEILDCFGSGLASQWLAETSDDGFRREIESFPSGSHDQRSREAD